MSQLETVNGGGRTPKWGRAVVALAFFAALIIAWQLIVQQLPGRRQVLLPTPVKVGRYLVEAVKSGDLFKALTVTTRRLLIGYVTGVVIGLPLGVLTARFRWAQDTLGVMGLGFQTLPSVCWVPLALLWFGQTEAAMLFVVLMGALWSGQIAVDNVVR